MSANSPLKRSGMIHVNEGSHSFTLWFGVAVTSLIVSTKLLYVEPG